ncbi:MAG: PEP-CTERM sorting domain-containing protein [Planctomycetales bacterium]|nr:PEP-CTERM sorting domain-containing protein [Planctomycetales bacterium]
MSIRLALSAAVTGAALLLAPQCGFASMILNEYNGVADGGSTGTADPFWGLTPGNGGNWFEMVVVGNGAAGTSDVRGYSIEVTDGSGDPAGLVNLSNDPFWSAVPNGSILTFIEKDTATGGLDTGLFLDDQRAAAGWSWSNIFLGDATLLAAGTTATLPISNSDTQIIVRDSPGGTIVFGPAGEAIADEGVNSSEVLKLEADPAPGIDVGPSGPYNDGASTTFGQPNVWDGGASVQSFAAYRVPEPSSLAAMLAAIAGGVMFARRK